MNKKMVVVWLNSDKELPSDNEKVLVVYGDEIKTATFEKGISVEEREKMKNGEMPDFTECGWCLSEGYKLHKRSTIIKGCDEFGNNLVPYCWRIGGNTIFGQNVKYWARFPDFDELQEKRKDE